MPIATPKMLEKKPVMNPTWPPAHPNTVPPTVAPSVESTRALTLPPDDLLQGK